MLDGEYFETVATTCLERSAPQISKTVRRRDVHPALKGIKVFAASLSIIDRKRLARLVRATADQIDEPTHDRMADGAFNLLEVVCDALSSVTTDVKIELDIPDHPIRMQGDPDALACALYDLAMQQAVGGARLWAKVQIDCRIAKVSLSGSTAIEEIPAVIYLTVARAGGRILLMQEALTVLLPLTGLSR